MVALEELGQDFIPGILISEDHHHASLQLTSPSQTELCHYNKTAKETVKGRGLRGAGMEIFPSSSKEERLG